MAHRRNPRQPQRDPDDTLALLRWIILALVAIILALVAALTGVRVPPPAGK